MATSSQAMTLSRSLPTLSLRRLAVTCLVVILLAPCTTVAQERAWELSFTAATDTFILKEPVWTRLTLTNVSGTALPKVGFWGHFYLDGQQQACFSDLAPVDEPVPPPRRRGPKVATPVPPQMVEPGWQRSIVVNLGDVCNLVRRGEKVLGKHSVCYRFDSSSAVSLTPACVSFALQPPEGVDKQAYEAFGHDPLAGNRRYGELLRRFPTSTYTAYLIWKLQVMGIASRDPEKMADSLALGLSHQWNSVPGPGGSAWMSLHGADLVKWRKGWFDTILKHHPNIWFADEVRFRIALDDYLLGDTDGCEAGLEDLAEHGKPYVASKAGELLAAMKAKGMLGEKAK